MRDNLLEARPVVVEVTKDDSIEPARRCCALTRGRVIALVIMLTFFGCAGGAILWLMNVGELAFGPSLAHHRRLARLEAPSALQRFLAATADVVARVSTPPHILDIPSPRVCFRFVGRSHSEHIVRLATFYPHHLSLLPPFAQCHSATTPCSRRRPSSKQRHCPCSHESPRVKKKVGGRIT
jgi:hypothetical protein